MSGKENSGEELSEELKTIEAALRQLTPLGGQIDRDRLMYLAGQASVSRWGSNWNPARQVNWQAKWKQNLWPLASAVLALISITLGGFLLHAKRSGERIVYLAPAHGIDAIAIAETASSTNANSGYFQLRNLVLTQGIDALPKSETSPVIEKKNELPTWKALFQQLPDGDS